MKIITNSACVIGALDEVNDHEKLRDIRSTYEGNLVMNVRTKERYA